jgi:hypothetical protein
MRPKHPIFLYGGRSDKPKTIFEQTPLTQTGGYC